MEEIKIKSKYEKPIIELVFNNKDFIRLDKQEAIELTLKLTKWLLENNDLE